jgi:hypothetical protein
LKCQTVPSPGIGGKMMGYSHLGIDLQKSAIAKLGSVLA